MLMTTAINQVTDDSVIFLITDMFFYSIFLMYFLRPSLKNLHKAMYYINFDV